VLFYVPAVLGALLEAQRTSTEPGPLLTVAMGGASNVPSTMIEAAEQVFGAAVINIYGQTELSPALTATRPGDTRRDQLHTVGQPLPQVEVKVVDPATGDVVALGEEGEICARGYQQLIAYLHDPEATARAVDAEGFVHTGDLGSMDERGYITLTGRLKELIIRGGENIAPAAVESCLAAHPNVLGATVFGLPDERMGEIVAAAVHFREPVAAEHMRVTFRGLVDHCRERLSPYKVPSRWFLAGELPVTPTGKVQKFRLANLVGTTTLHEVVPAD
jgi:fatty-acyl-CoA synthase